MKTAKTIILVFIFLLFSFEAQAQAASYQYDWPTLAHDMKRSGSTVVGPDGPYTKVWYRDFWSEFQEAVYAGYQSPIVRDQTLGHNNIDLVYVGTSSGSMYALNLSNGNIYWRYPAAGYIGGILTSPTIEEAVVYFGSLDGKVYALDGANVTGGIVSPKWVFDTGRQGGFWSTPVVTADSVYIGGRDGYFYALDKNNGARRWEENIGAPILTSPSYDGVNLYFGAENMKAYAYSTSGARVWESYQLAGQSMRRNYPVVTDNFVAFRTAPNDIHTGLLDEGEQLLAFAAGCTDYPSHWGGSGRPADVVPCFNDAAVGDAVKFAEEDRAVKSYLSGSSYTVNGRTVLGRPQYETFHALRKDSGQRYFAQPVPVLFTAGSNNPGVPPVVGPDGKIYALYRSYYSDYDVRDTWYIFGAFGELNPVNDTISIINPSNHSDGWNSGIWMIGDETTAFSVGGDKIYTNHWGGLGSVDITTRAFETVISDRDHLDRALTAGGNPRVFFFGQRPEDARNDVAYGPSIFGDKIIACNTSVIGMVQGHLSGTSITPILTMAPHANKPFTSTDLSDVAIPSQPTLERYIWDVPSISNIASGANDLKAKLESEINDFLDTGKLAPWYFLPGRANSPSGYFLEPDQTQYALGLAYPYLSPTLQQRVKSFVITDASAANPLTGRYLWNEGLTYNDGINVGQVIDSGGKQRQPFPPGPMRYCQEAGGCEGTIYPDFSWFPVSGAFDRLYNLWSYAYRSQDWSWIEANWPSIRSSRNVVNAASDDSLLGLVTSSGAGGKSSYDSANRRLSALIAYTRIAQHMNDAAEVSWATNAATLAMQARFRYVNNFRPTDGNGLDLTTSNWWGWPDASYPPAGLFFQAFGWQNPNIPQLREITPEVGRLLADNAALDMNRYEKFIDTVHPPLYLQRGPTSITFSEIAYAKPPDIQSIFLEKALVANHNGDYLRKYLDIPWVNQDYFYWERLTRTIEAYGITSWCDVRDGSCAVTPPLLTGDINSDTFVNVLDVQACVNHILGIQDLGSRGDVNGDGSTDVLDVQNIVNIILG